MKTPKPDIQKLFNVWEDNQMMAQKSTELPFESLHDLIPTMFSSGPMYYYIIDFYDMSLSHVSESIKNIHSLDPLKTTFNEILTLIHPDDMEHVAKSEKLVLDMIYGKIGFENCTKYKMHYCFRFKTADSSYKLFLHQAIILSVDAINHKVSKSLNIHTDISEITQQNNYHVSLIGMMGEPSYINIGAGGVKEGEYKTSSGVVFSNRETEVLKLISQGMTNAKIAEKLCIANDTVKNHRRNIMKKAGVNNTAALIAKCMFDGML